MSACASPGGPPASPAGGPGLPSPDSAASPVCFCTGTHILTTRGEVPVEALGVGDLAVMASGAPRRIYWIGSREMEGARMSAPVRVRAGAFGGGLPRRDLYLSPAHRVLVGAAADGSGGLLVPIEALVNQTTVARVAPARVTYWHIELDTHDVVLAEGLPAESYLDAGNRAFFTRHRGHPLRSPYVVAPGLSLPCRPVAATGPRVAAERVRLDQVFGSSLWAHCAWEDAGAPAWLAAQAWGPVSDETSQARSACDPVRYPSMRS